MKKYGRKIEFVYHNVTQGHHVHYEGDGHHYDGDGHEVQDALEARKKFLTVLKYIIHLYRLIPFNPLIFHSAIGW